MKNKGRDITIILLVAFLFLASCEKEKPEPPDFSSKIEITNGAPTNITSQSAILHGSIGDTHGQSVQNYGHCWDTLPNPDLKKSHSSLYLYK